MDLLKMFLNLLSSRTTYRDDQPAEFQIDDTYSVPVLRQNDFHVNFFKYQHLLKPICSFTRESAQ